MKISKWGMANVAVSMGCAIAVAVVQMVCTIFSCRNNERRANEKHELDKKAYAELGIRMPEEEAHQE